MDERRVKKINQLLLKCQNANFWNKSNTLNQLANEIIQDIGQNTFLININKKYSVIPSQDIYSRSDKSNKIQIASDIYESGDTGHLLYDLIHEAVHKVQDQADKYLEQNDNEHIRALRINGSTTTFQLNGKNIEIPNYFSPPIENDFWGYVDTSAYCYKLQPREIQARHITFQILNELMESPFIENEFKDSILNTIKALIEEMPTRLKSLATKNCVGIDIQREIEKLLLCLDGERGLVVDFRVEAVFRKSQEKYLSELDKEIFRELPRFFGPKSNDRADFWDELQELEDIKLEMKSPISERDSRILRTLLISTEDEEFKRDWK